LLLIAWMEEPRWMARSLQVTKEAAHNI
jgi:hypothetical protein